VFAAQAAATVTTNYDYYIEPRASEAKPFIVSRAIPADPALHDTLLTTLTTAVGPLGVRDVELHASADCFYSSQGRIDQNFADDNETLIADLQAQHPSLLTLEVRPDGPSFVTPLSGPPPPSPLPLTR